jgi:hypothetical protein
MVNRFAQHIQRTFNDSAARLVYRAYAVTTGLIFLLIAAGCRPSNLLVNSP